MAAPTFVNAGTGVVVTNSLQTCTSGTGSAGDLLILQICLDGSSTSFTSVLGNGSGFATLDGVDDATRAYYLTTAANTTDVVWGGDGTNVHQRLFFARATGTGAASIEIDAPVSTEDQYARWYRFSNVCAAPNWRSLAENGGSSSATTLGTSTTIADAGVTTNGPDRLCVNFVIVNDDNAVGAFTGMTGGTWAEATAEFASATGTDACIQLQTATLSSAGTIDGGTYTMAASDGWGVLGFALISADNRKFGSFTANAIIRTTTIRSGKKWPGGTFIKSPYSPSEARWVNGVWLISDLGKAYYTTDPAGEVGWVECSTGLGSIFQAFEITYANGYWVMTGSGGAAVGSFYYSTNLSGSWTSNPPGGANVLYSVTYANGYWVISGAAGTVYYMQSSAPTGTWTSNPPSTTDGIHHGYGNGYWLLLGTTAGHAWYRATDPTGTWTSTTIGTGYNEEATYANGYWLVTTYVNGEGPWYRATDPTGTWTENHPSGETQHSKFSTYAPNYWWIIGSGTNNYYLESPYPTGTWTAVSKASGMGYFAASSNGVGWIYSDATGTWVAAGGITMDAFIPHYFTANAVIVSGAGTGNFSANAVIKRTWGGGEKYSSLVLAHSPIGYWRLGESSGNPQDSSGRGNHMTTVNGTPDYAQPSLITGDANKSVGLVASSSESFNSGGSWDFDLGDVGSIEAWVKLAATGGGEQIIFSRQSGYAIGISAITTDRIFFAKAGYAILCESTVTLNTERHHIVATKNGTASKIYLDGQDVTGTVTDAPFATGYYAVNIGQDSSANSYWNGLVDEVAFYPKTLTQYEVVSHFNSGVGSSAAFTADAVILRNSGTKTFAAEAVVKKTISGAPQTFTANAVIFKAGITPGTQPTANAVIFRNSGTKTFSADAVIKKTQTTGKSWTADAVVFRNSGTKTFTAEAIVFRNSGTKTFSADSVVKKTISGAPQTFTADSVVKKTQTTGKTWTADAIVKRTMPAAGASFTADAVIKRTFSGAQQTFTADAVLKKTQTTGKSWTADAVAKKTWDTGKSWTADAVVFKNSGTKTFSADAVILRSSGTKTFTADAVVFRTTSSSFSANAFFLGWFTADAWVYGPKLGDFVADAIVRKTISGSFSADAVVFANSGTKTFSADAVVLRSSGTKALAADALIVVPIWYDTFTRANNSVIGSPDIGNTAYSEFGETGGGIRISNNQLFVGSEDKGSAEGVRGPRIGVVSFDVLIRTAVAALPVVVQVGGYQIWIDYQEGGIAGLTGETVVSPGNPTSVQSTDLSSALDGEVWTIKAWFDGTYNAGVKTWKTGTTEPSSYSEGGGIRAWNSWLPGRVSIDSSASSNRAIDNLLVLMAEGPSWTMGQVTLNATLKKTQSKTFSANAVILANSGTKPIYSDAIVLASSGTKTFSADAIVKKTQAGSYTTDAVLLKSSSGTFTANAVVKAAQPGTFTADAVVFRVQTGSLTADAVARQTLEGSVPALAVLHRVGTAYLATDAIVQREQAGSLTADAVSRRTQAGSFSTDAVINRTQAGAFTAEAVILAAGAAAFTADALKVSVGRCVWTTPGNYVQIDAQATLAFLMPAAWVGKAHFEIQLDLANTFDTVELVIVTSYSNQTGWEYWDGDSWEPIPADGLPNTYAGNEARYTIQAPLDNGTWYRRVRAGVY